MKCYFCDTELSWDSEYDYSGISDDKEGIVVNLSCPKCDVTFICEQLKDKPKAPNPQTRMVTGV